jgi:hypothetical protein
MSRATEGFSARTAMVPDSLAVIDSQFNPILVIEWVPFPAPWGALLRAGWQRWVVASIEHRIVVEGLQIPPLRSPGFPVELVGFDEPHAPFFMERRIRGFCEFCVAGNPGTLRSG